MLPCLQLLVHGPWFSTLLFFPLPTRSPLAASGPWQGYLSRRRLLGLLPLLAGFHSGSANERPAGGWRAGGESGPGLLPVPVLPACAACPRGARVSPGPASRMPRAEWWPCPLWAPRHPPLDPVSTSCIRGSAFGPCGAFSPLADAAVLQTLTHPGLITTGPQRRERLLPVHTCRGPRLKGRSCRRELTRRCSVLAEIQNRSGRVCVDCLPSRGGAAWQLTAASPVEGLCAQQGLGRPPPPGH